MAGFIQHGIVFNVEPKTRQDFINAYIQQFGNIRNAVNFIFNNIIFTEENFKIIDTENDSGTVLQKTDS